MGLEDIFEKFNINRPEDFKGHSLSVSDIVILNKNNKATAHFVDSFGFKEVPKFIYDKEKIEKEGKNIKKLKVKLDLDER